MIWTHGLQPTGDNRSAGPGNPSELREKPYTYTFPSCPDAPDRCSGGMKGPLAPWRRSLTLAVDAQSSTGAAWEKTGASPGDMFQGAVRKSAAITSHRQPGLAGWARPRPNGHGPAAGPASISSLPFFRAGADPAPIFIRWAFLLPTGYLAARALWDLCWSAVLFSFFWAGRTAGVPLAGPGAGPVFSSPASLAPSLPPPSATRGLDPPKLGCITPRYLPPFPGHPP